MTSAVASLSRWAGELRPTEADLALAERALLDTVAVTVAATAPERRPGVVDLTAGLSDAVRLGATGHVLDFDDLHLPSTSHISVVCVPAALVSGGGPRSYLAAAGVMARLGAMLGWRHYTEGWHITCTTGAIAAAAGAAVAYGLPAGRIAAAMALAVPAAGGVQRAFGTDAKSLQVGFAVDAGVRAARLAARGASADPSAVDAWLDLMGAPPERALLAEPAVPGGLAIKFYPACYALQRPLALLGELRRGGLDPDDVVSVTLRTPAGAVVPLIHHRPTSGLEGKFSLEYAAAAALLDPHPGFASFDDDDVARPAAQALLRRVEVVLSPGGDGLLDGDLKAEVELRDGSVRTGDIGDPPGSPSRPLSAAEFDLKIEDCLRGTDVDLAGYTWRTAASLLLDQIERTGSDDVGTA